MPKLFFAIAVLFWAPLWSQDSTATTLQDIRYDQRDYLEPVSFDQEALKKLREDKAFDYTEYQEPDTVWSRFKRWVNERWRAFIRWLTGSEEATGFWGFVLRVLPYLAIAGILFLFIWLILKIDERSLQRTTNTLNQYLSSKDQEIIEHDDIQALIEQALAVKNYRLAIRFYYLLLLQRLSDQEHIDWQAQKTNREYLYEIKQDELRESFRRVTRIYDYSWYGQFEVDESAFAKAKLQFSNLEALL
ncbi:DUF4129 domain-containing protein [Croceiramulus getboli]|nr:DUF4129 domain-containing protein [Flavobacteriaceae bacterium YJPT1-3]